MSQPIKIKYDCPACKGSGFIDGGADSRECSECDGQGSVVKNLREGEGIAFRLRPTEDSENRGSFWRLVPLLLAIMALAYGCYALGFAEGRAFSDRMHQVER